ncbi:hypothetical protein BW723_04890 [Polaribacter reichenbachii]|uniref:Addiction module component n=1 Tax=Polaribacter reichenbachii TaxID=996801 RepID=A0A1B8TUP4_9FLAO|nr:hypothetical protein [Polaribacter reichenbachii]APZ45674.1 hypothetical protein BW723_04890 [Polaribacter reichenbachii]AUC19536.1 hypothetical protein BTO17_12900 [Polaribacter reichenbachii]OBY63310.1 hypothetical protein LPB301_10820 [Polaribacter reichenbachii]
MDLQADLKWIHKELDEVEDVSLIQIIKNIIENRKNVTSGRISTTQYNAEIDSSIAQIKEGKTISHSEVGKQIMKWSEK